MFLFFLGVVFTLIMLAFLGFLVMYTVISLKLLRVGSREDNINKKRSAQRSLLLSVCRHGAGVYCVVGYYDVPIALMECI